MAETEGKKLTELRVIDLKTELERRGLDKTGNKAALLERLSKAISDEGNNPEEYLIIPCVGGSLSTPKGTPRKNSVTGASSQEDSIDKPNDNMKEETSEPINHETVKEKIEETSFNALDEDITEVNKENKASPSESDAPIEEIRNQPKEEEVATLTKEETVENESNDAIKIEDPKPEPVKSSPPVVPNPPIISTAIEANGIDNEDSINLTIGEDEENLLVEESESQDRLKDGGADQKKKMEENKKGDSKGSGRAESGANNKEGTTSSSSNVGTKSSKQDPSDGGSKSSESGGKGQKREDKDKKVQISSPNASSRNLWVSGLSSTTRATDLKQIFSKYGKVIGAKVVTNARTPGARCYGYVTMSTSEDAAKCIQHLHRTELHGRVISVEKAKGDNQQSHIRKRDFTNGKSEKKDEKDKGKDNVETNDKKDIDGKKDAEEKGNLNKRNDEKNDHSESKKSDPIEKKDDTKEFDARSTKSTSKKSDSDRSKRDDKRIRHWNHRSYTRSRSRDRRRRDDVLTFTKIREERERQRLRERERVFREEERRRREDMEREYMKREIDRRHRDEAARLEREREKLRREKEWIEQKRLEQKRAELLHLERERQKIEREKLEREKLELKRQQLRLEESRRAPPPPSIKRSSSDRRDPRDLYVEPERKRLAADDTRRHSPDRVPGRRAEILDRVSDRRMETSPLPRYESSRSTQEIGLKKEFKRGSEFTSRGSRPETFPEVTRGREVIVRRDSLSTATTSIDPRQVKERYDRPSATSYSREREVRRSEPEATHRSSRDSHTRYSDSFKPPSSNTARDSRYVESNRSTSGWHTGGPPSSKSFNSVPSGGARDPRNEPSSWNSSPSESVNRWGNSTPISNTMRHPVPPRYQSGPIQTMGIATSGSTQSYDRFDPYKSSIPNMRKY